MRDMGLCYCLSEHLCSRSLLPLGIWNIVFVSIPFAQGRLIPLSGLRCLDAELVLVSAESLTG